jgi:hypothetical protein
MQGQQYCSPSKKYLGQEPLYVSTLGRTRRKISARHAAIPLPKPTRSAAELMVAFQKHMQEKKLEDMQPDMNHGQPSYNDCGGVGNDTMSIDVDDGYSGDQEMVSNEEEDEEEEESFDNMRPEGIEKSVNAAMGRQVFNHPRFFKARRSYAYNAKRYKANWRDFVECVTGDLAWRSLGNSISVCDCEESAMFPAVSLTGTSSMFWSDIS